MEEQIQKIEVAAKKTWPMVMAWVGGITALIGLFASIAGGVTWLVNHHRHTVEYQAKMATAEVETSQKQYQEALNIYREILKGDPLDRPAIDGELSTAMAWVENLHFSLYVPEGKDEDDMSRDALDQLLPVLTSGLARAKEVRVADIQAHLGWAHFLNAKIAQREDDSVAVDDWHAALTKDPTNAYANAMLGNWMLQSDGDFREAVEHLRTAVRTGRARPFVRRLQVGGLLGLDLSGARVEMMRIANEMRKGGEELDLGERHRIAGWCFNPMFMNYQQLVEVLSAVPSEDAWNTYSWLAASSESGTNGSRDFMNEFVHANLLELGGRRDAALEEYRQLERELRDRPGSFQNQVRASIKRLAAPKS